MAHCRLLFVGTKKNLRQIYADCGDSSSESSAEMAFGADWISDSEWSDNPRNTDEFTKEDKELYQQILDGLFVYCFDIRDTKRYGDYSYINGFGERMYNEETHEEDNLRVVEHIKGLPSDTIFFFADSHW